MYARLTQIDDLTRPDHTFLGPSDRCYYLGEYTARGGFGASATNDLILNLKKPIERRGRPEWRYKEWAIRTIADDLRKILGKAGIEGATFVPVPPSKAKSDPAYDDRLMRILAALSAGYDADVRELVVQQINMAASHSGEARATIKELVENYVFIEDLARPPRDDHFVIFDDVLTTGRHFKAMQSVLSARFPGSHTYGLFVARRVPKTDDLESFS